FWAANLAMLVLERGSSGSQAFIGVPYIAAPILGLALMRSDPDFGLAALVWLMLIVWSADSFAYLVGRVVGGAKLAPRISPGKTWSGLFGALLGGAAAAALVGLM